MRTMEITQLTMYVENIDTLTINIPFLFPNKLHARSFNYDYSNRNPTFTRIWTQLKHPNGLSLLTNSDAKKMSSLRVEGSLDNNQEVANAPI